MTNASKQRIERFIDWFIRSDYMQSRVFGASSDMFIEDPNRANRCYDAAKNGCDGSTHRERIQDWRDAFSNWIADRRKWQTPDRFIAGVNDYFDDLETWHEKNGTLFREID